MELLRDTILQDGKITSVTIKWYSDLKVELGKYGIPVDDISKLAKLVNGIKQYQYDVQNVINQFLDLEIRRINYKYLQENVPPLENRKTYLETMISMHNQAPSNYQKLEIMGFGLQYLWTTVNEIARENNIPPKEAVTKFLSDVERQYNNKLGFECKVESLRNEVNKLNQHTCRITVITIGWPQVNETNSKWSNRPRYHRHSCYIRKVRCW